MATALNTNKSLMTVMAIVAEWSVLACPLGGSLYLFYGEVRLVPSACAVKQIGREKPGLRCTATLPRFPGRANQTVAGGQNLLFLNLSSL